MFRIEMTDWQIASLSKEARSELVEHKLLDEEQVESALETVNLERAIAEAEASLRDYVEASEAWANLKSNWPGRSFGLTLFIDQLVDEGEAEAKPTLRGRLWTVPIGKLKARELFDIIEEFLPPGEALPNAGNPHRRVAFDWMISHLGGNIPSSNKVADHLTALEELLL